MFYDNHYLYIFAPDNECRQRWVQALKEGQSVRNKGATWLKNVALLLPFYVASFSISYYSFLSHAETKDNNLVAKYHPNLWMDSKWRCCQQTEKLAAGCHVYDPLGFGLYSLFHFVFLELIMWWLHYLDVTHNHWFWTFGCVPFPHSF